VRTAFALTFFGVLAYGFRAALADRGVVFSNPQFWFLLALGGLCLLYRRRGDHHR